MTSQEHRHIKTIIGENIRAARAAAGLTQRELGQRVNGVDTLAVWRWENGKAVPTPNNLVALSLALKRDVAWFYTDHADRPAAA